MQLTLSNSYREKAGYCHHVSFVSAKIRMPGRKRKQEDTTDSGATASAPAKDPAKMTVAELKKELQDRGLDTSGKKAELVARLQGATSSSKGGTDSTDAGEPPSAKKQKTSSGILCVWLLVCYSHLYTNLGGMQACPT